MNTDTEVEFSGFTPTPGTTLSVNATLTWLLDVVAEDAHVNARLRKAGSQFVCTIELLSTAGCFRSEQIGTSPQEALDEAVKEVKESAKDWHETRPELDYASFIELIAR